MNKKVREVIAKELVLVAKDLVSTPKIAGTHAIAVSIDDSIMAIFKKNGLKYVDAKQYFDENKLDKHVDDIARMINDAIEKAK